MGSTPEPLGHSMEPECEEGRRTQETQSGLSIPVYLPSVSLPSSPQLPRP